MLVELISNNLQTYENLVKANQAELDAEGKGGQAIRDSRRILHDDKYIILWTSRKDVCDVLDYTPDLYSLLTRTECCTFDVNNRGRTTIGFSQFRENRNLPRITLARFAYYYGKYNMEAEAFVPEFIKISKIANSNGIHIDHANDNYHVHCMWNLSPMSISLNSSKSTYVSSIKPPYYCFIAVTRDNEYRAEFGYITPKQAQAHYIVCKTPELLVDFLRSVYTRFVPTNKLPAHLRNFGIPIFQRVTYSANPYFAEGLSVSALAADRLLSMPEERFIIWSGEEKWESGLICLSN